ncbi:MAG: YihY/virulence factor BrkB family protein [Desulfobacteraceae bacterium]|nr:YihY/virulence factor BrkB family protein [Desulfobacteraceae bacterium]
MLNSKKELFQWYQKCVKVIFSAFKGFQEDRCGLRASALTLYTIFAIVPVMAMAFGIAKGFGFQKFLEGEVLLMFEGREEIINNVLTFSTNLLDKTKGGAMAILGIILLIYSMVKLLGHIENAFNRIWWVKGARPIIRKITDYMTISIAAGLLVILSSSANIFITTRLGKFLVFLNLPDSLGKLISFGFNIFPFLPIWILFVFFYVIIPNKKIDIKAAIAGAIIAGTIFQLVQISYLKFQVGVSSYNAIYGSFAALPLFLIWVQISWAILLYGAEIAFSWENTTTLETNELRFENLSLRLQKLMSLRIVLLCVKRFARGNFPATELEISKELKLPLRIIQILLEKLLEANLLFQVASSSNYMGYSPAVDIESLSIMDVITAFEQPEGKCVQVSDAPEFEALEESLNIFTRSAINSSGERKLKDI